MNYLETYKDQTILITGGAGAIGSNLSRKLANAGAKKVIILDDLSASYEWNVPNLPNVLFVNGNITQFKNRSLPFFNMSPFSFNCSRVNDPLSSG